LYARVERNLPRSAAIPWHSEERERQGSMWLKDNIVRIKLVTKPTAYGDAVVLEGQNAVGNLVAGDVEDGNVQRGTR